MAAPGTTLSNLGLTTVTVEATTPFIATTCFPSVTGIGIDGWNMSSARVAVVCKIMAVGRWK